MPEKEVVKELITNQEWFASILLFLSGLLGTIFKFIRGGHKFNFWFWISSGVLGGIVSVGIGHGLLWVFPTMNYVTAWGISSALMILLSDKDMREFIMSKKNGK